MDESDGTSIEHRCSPSRTSVAEIEFKVGQPNSEQQKWAQMHLLSKRQSESQSNNIT